MKIKVSEYRKKARASLEGQWGINAWIIFLSIVIGIVLQEIFGGFFPTGSTQSNIFNFLLQHVLVFAFTYGVYYISLVVVRGGQAKPNLLFAVFQKEYFVPILLINLFNAVVNWLINGIIFLPGFLIGGFNTYVDLLFNGNTAPQQIMPDYTIDLSFAVLTTLLFFVSLFAMTVVMGLFQFAAWTKFDYPKLTVIQSLRYAWFLLKDRIWTYLLLQLSFIGWYILGFIALFFGLLWVIVYVNVSIAEFYEQARIEKGSPMEYFSLG
ncbi:MULTISPECIES: DUF975 family protein [Enterococcus]|uniref:DUF975 domain-containing protein n=1 Tax=Candidatus Enterococcus mangumiae TaxID=2230878 RepID=A0ABZ2SXJ5_9ENTE|nr:MULTISPECIES: DUF975 family protein [unclassified Enterococcus]MBO0461082.1 DUF975 family protein [Enterococcus sp. DIV1298c]MBO0490173.1 DUF975 family protein [Enterococcus sp. DIV1094]MBO1298832.1 DUF975 family protein [Enterococcus sp. DIV1271a]